MNVRNRKSSRRNGQVMVRTILALGAVTAGVLAYLLSGVDPLEAVVLPAIVLGLVVFGLALYSRARARQDWSAAWEAYAEREVAHDAFDSTEEERAFSVAATN
jgi:hypothetical protein